MNHKFTQGEWKLSLAAININTLEIIAEGKRIAELNAMGVRMNNDELFANAKLIIAAPELLGCAERFLDSIDYQIKRDENSSNLEGARLKSFMRQEVASIISKAIGGK